MDGDRKLESDRDQILRCLILSLDSIYSPVGEGIVGSPGGLVKKVVTSSLAPF